MTPRDGFGWTNDREPDLIRFDNTRSGWAVIDNIDTAVCKDHGRMVRYDTGMSGSAWVCHECTVSIYACKRCFFYNGFLEKIAKGTLCIAQSSCNGCYKASKNVPHRPVEKTTEEKNYPKCMLHKCPDPVVLGSKYCKHHDTIAHQLKQEKEKKIDEKPVHFKSVKEMILAGCVPGKVVKMFNELSKLEPFTWYKGFKDTVKDKWLIRPEFMRPAIRHEIMVKAEGVEKEADNHAYGTINCHLYKKVYKLFDQKTALDEDGEKKDYLRLNRIISSPLDLFKFLIGYKEPKEKKSRKIVLGDLLFSCFWSFVIGFVLGGVYGALILLWD